MRLCRPVRPLERHEFGLQPRRRVSFAMRIVEPRNRIRLGSLGEDHNVVDVDILLRPPIPSGMNEIGLAPDA